jgi:hypothetical protein
VKHQVGGEVDALDRPGVGALDQDAHAGVAGDASHRLVLGQAMHEQLDHAAVAGVQDAALEHRRCDAAAAVAGQHAQAELGCALEERDMGHAGQVRHGASAEWAT